MRNRFLVAYDIADSKRLRNVHNVVMGYGYVLQYSVFVCDLSQVEMTGLRTELREVIHFREDRVVFIDLGPPEGRGATCMSFMGQKPDLSESSGPTII